MRTIRKFSGILLFTCLAGAGAAQDNLPAKVHHVEPLYNDLIRDLGARKGEHEWNVGMGTSRHNGIHSFSTLVEYEFAPVNRLGFEVEMPVSLRTQKPQDTNAALPGNRIESLKLAMQYTFFVSPLLQASAAAGYIHEFGLVEFRQYGKASLLTGNTFHPFLVLAKSWKHGFHTMFIAGPEIEQPLRERAEYSLQLSGNVHYLIPHTSNFVGLEVNAECYGPERQLTLRPQMRVTLTPTTKVGLVAGIPLAGEEPYNFFVRLIYEPPGRTANVH